MSNDGPQPQPARRGFLKQVVGATAALPLIGGAAAVAESVSAAPAPAASAPVLGYTSFSGDEAAFVETMVNVMCPADEYTPNGVDCGLAAYIDRQLAGDFGKGARRYMRGPWQVGKPQQGYQLPLTPEQFFKAGIEAANAVCATKYGKPFDQVSAVDDDGFLSDLAAGKVSDASLPLASWFTWLRGLLGGNVPATLSAAWRESAIARGAGLLLKGLASTERGQARLVAHGASLDPTAPVHAFDLELRYPSSGETVHGRLHLDGLGLLLAGGVVADLPVLSATTDWQDLQV